MKGHFVIAAKVNLSARNNKIETKHVFLKDAIIQLEHQFPSTTKRFWTMHLGKALTFNETSKARRAIDLYFHDDMKELVTIHLIG